MPAIRDRIIKGGSIQNIDYLVESHTAYKHYINRWLFLGDSFQGGYDYYTGKYLEPYYYESRDDYEKRLRMIGLDNHVKSVVGIYNSFLFRKDVKRDYGSIENDPGLQPFLKDADLDGRSFESFMKDLSAFAMVYGNAWVVIDKPNVVTRTRADELEQSIRPYVSMFTPDNVLDWSYDRLTNGLYVLNYLKVKEEIADNRQYIREYTPEEINVYLIDADEKEADLVETIPNELGRVPAVCVYAQRSNIRGIGISAVGDIADIQKELNEYSSEMEQIIRLTNHPSLVKEVGVEAAAGAGSIIQIPQGADPGLKPYLLQPNGASIDSLINAMDKRVEAIDRMACLGGIRSIESRRLSGIGLQTEFQMLNAKLADFAMNYEHAEEQIWRCWAMYQGNVWNGEIEYARSFSIQDKANDVAMLKLAKEANIADPNIIDALDKEIYETIMEEPYEAPQQPLQTAMTHPPMENPQDMITHMREMLEQGYTNEQILELHPEIANFFGNNQDG
jgi:hypothetical protein